MKKLFLLIVCNLISVSLFAQAQYTVKFIKVDTKYSEKPEPSAGFWKDVTPIKINLSAQQMTQPTLKESTVANLTFRSVHNNDTIFVLLEWGDSTRDSSLETEKMTDACAIQFPIKEMTKTSPFMGSKNSPVAIGQWKAVWQTDVEKGFQRIKDIYPNTWVENTDKFGQNTALLSKNQASRDDRTTPSQLAIAEGFGSLALQPTTDLKSWGVWEKNTWKVGFAMKMKSEKLKLESGKVTGISFAIWEGGKGNVGSRKNILMSWQPILIEAGK
ncbi:MAG: ethylbenzene dehydrogenase-related protein [Leptospiraceae bacterium]|nr:hypothetical protein [Leptospiraceae bacterium]MCK6379872.1 ethylbenzene dehydrogenase-related protein [Leptospiraceae bacterium]NUM41571.1 hypothetical protein [Leptospiraceae bacterium]